jgi:hypothetical protein
MLGAGRVGSAAVGATWSFAPPDAAATATGTTEPPSTRYVTALYPREGQQRPSSGAYRTNVAARLPSRPRVVDARAPSVLANIGSGARVPANLPPTKTNALYPAPRHIPSCPAVAVTTVVAPLV